MLSSLSKAVGLEPHRGGLDNESVIFGSHRRSAPVHLRHPVGGPAPHLAAQVLVPTALQDAGLEAVAG